MFRHRYLAVSALSSIAIGSIAMGLGGEALAQRGHPGVPAMAAPHMAAPAPYMAAPAPHFAAPAPHMAAPAPHFAAPAPHSLHMAPELSRHAPTLSPEASRPALANSRAAPVENRAEHRQPATPGQTVGSTAHQAIGQGPATANRVRGEQARTPPILQNPAFADRRMAAVSHMAPSQQTFRGQFAQAGWARDWRHHHHHLGIVLGFVGAVFWPYAYDDFVDYTFAPYAYDTFWPYAFDDVYAGIYGGYAPVYYGPEDAYAYAGSVASQSSYDRTAATNGTASFPRTSFLASTIRRRVGSAPPTR